MDDTQSLLEDRFASLRESRSFPVFFIEHGLPEDALERLTDQVRSAAEKRPIDDRWWKSRSLSLIVVATEVGYRYRGSGTDFWPVLEAETGIHFGTLQRRRTRDFFAAAAERFGGAVPASTPWADAFHLIAWPITHALLPLELHRPLALTLPRLREYAGEMDDEDLHRAIIFAAHDRRPRFRALVENEEVVVPLVRRLLSPKVEGFSREVIDRITLDLEKDTVARKSVQHARRRQLRARRGGAERGAREAATRRVGGLSIRRTDSGLVLEGVLPASSDESFGQMRRTLRRRRFSPRLWGVSQQVPSEQLLSGLPFPIRLAQVPPVGSELLPGLDGEGFDQEAHTYLSELELPLSESMLFAVDASGESARLIQGPQVSAHRKYWVLVDRNTALDRGGVNIGEIGPYRCSALDPERDDHRQVLGSLGYSVRFDVRVSVLGPPHAQRGLPLPSFFEGDRIFVVPERLPEPRFRLVADESEISGDEGEAVEMAVREGASLVAVESGRQAANFRYTGRSRPTTLAPPVCSIELVSHDPSVGALARGELAFEVKSHLAFEGLELRAWLDGPGVSESAATRLDRVPTIVTSARPPLSTLVEAAGYEQLFNAPGLSLRLAVGNLTSGTWPLEARTRACWWEDRGDAEGFRLTSDLGDLEHGIVAGSAPYEHPREGSPTTEESVALLAPIGADPADFGPSGQFSGLCVAPDSGSLEFDAMQVPEVRRGRDDSEDAIGLERVVEAYLRWATAETRTLLAEIRRRQVTDAIDSLLTRVACGDAWAAVEAAREWTDPWELLANRVKEAKLGRDSYLTDLQDDTWDHVVDHSVEVLRQGLPNLWTIARPKGSLQESDWLRLEEALLTGYGEVGRHLLGTRHSEQGQSLQEGDPTADFDREAWSSVLGSVLADHDLATLAAKVMPTDSAAYFMALDATAVNLDDIVEELHRWARRNARAFFSPVPDPETIHSLAALWIEPAVAVRTDWRATIDVLVAERSLCRAARYFAVKLRNARLWNYS